MLSTSWGTWSGVASRSSKREWADHPVLAASRSTWNHTKDVCTERCWQQSYRDEMLVPTGLCKMSRCFPEFSRDGQNENQQLPKWVFSWSHFSIAMSVSFIHRHIKMAERFAWGFDMLRALIINANSFVSFPRSLWLRKVWFSSH